MTSLIVIGVLAVVLFVLAFVSKRRIGVLGLALGAGALLSAMWGGSVTPLLERSGVVLSSPPLSAVVAAGLIILPALILIVSGPKYHGSGGRLFGAAAFSVLAVVLLSDALEAALVIEGLGAQILASTKAAKPYIITVGLTIALIDVLMTKSTHGSHAKGKGKH